MELLKGSVNFIAFPKYEFLLVQLCWHQIRLKCHHNTKEVTIVIITQKKSEFSSWWPRSRNFLNIQIKVPLMKHLHLILVELIIIYLQFPGMYIWVYSTLATTSCSKLLHSYWYLGCWVYVCWNGEKGEHLFGNNRELYSIAHISRSAN